MKSRSRSARELAAFGMIVVLSLAAAGGASATTATGQTRQLTVSVSLASSGPDREAAAVGDTVTAALSITNRTYEFQEVPVRVTLMIPDGRSFEGAVTLPLAPFQTLAPRIRYTVNEFFPKGLYSVTLEASTSSGAASATATITII